MLFLSRGRCVSGGCVRKQNGLLFRCHWRQGVIRSHSMSPVMRNISHTTTDAKASVALLRRGGFAGFFQPFAAVGQMHAHGGAGRLRILAGDRVQDVLVFPVGAVEVALSGFRGELCLQGTVSFIKNGKSKKGHRVGGLFQRCFGTILIYRLRNHNP